MKKSKGKTQKANQRPEFEAWDAVMCAQIAACESSIRHLQLQITTQRNLLTALRLSLAAGRKAEAAGREARSQS
jgi:hypothetical protein